MYRTLSCSTLYITYNHHPWLTNTETSSHPNLTPLLQTCTSVALVPSTMRHLPLRLRSLSHVEAAVLTHPQQGVLLQVTEGRCPKKRTKFFGTFSQMLDPPTPSPLLGTPRFKNKRLYIYLWNKNTLNFAPHLEDWYLPLSLILTNIHHSCTGSAVTQ